MEDHAAGAAPAPEDSLPAAFEGALRGCRKEQLLALLAAVEVRLGTADERADDVPRARAIAHQLNNLLTAERLGAGGDEAEPEGGPATS